MSVSDIEAVTSWYTNVLGFQIIGGKIAHIRRSEKPDAPIFAIYGDSLQEVKLAYMATGNGSNTIAANSFTSVLPIPVRTNWYRKSWRLEEAGRDLLSDWQEELLVYISRIRGEILLKF